MDAVGGGGRGPEGISTLLGAGADPRTAIGTTNTAEFFVAGTVVGAFLWALLTGGWAAEGLRDQVWAVAGLVAGGVVVAPVAGWTTKVLPIRFLTWLVGGLVVVLAAWQAIDLIA